MAHPTHDRYYDNLHLAVWELDNMIVQILGGQETMHAIDSARVILLGEYVQLDAPGCSYLGGGNTRLVITGQLMLSVRNGIT